MDREWKVMWVDALRSGEYDQARQKLRVKKEIGRKFGYCCLGVLCDIHPEIRWDGDGWAEYKEVSEVSILPTNFLEDIGLEWKEMTDLTHMNDNGYSFDKIADYIEENL